MSAITQDFRQTTVIVHVSGIPLKSGSTVAHIHKDLACSVRVEAGAKVTEFKGDHTLLRDLVAVLERYLALNLSAQYQGTFSGTVAIRPLDFMFHRLTVRQGEGIAQLDLSMTQLYDLVEALEEIADAMPQLPVLKASPKRSGSNWGVGIAALVVGGIGIATAITILGGLERERDDELIPPTVATLERSSNDESQVLVEDQDPDAESAESPQLDGSPSENSEDSEPEAPLSPQAAEIAPEEVGSRDIAALPAPIVDTIVELSEAGSTLQSSLSESWSAPEDFSLSLSYTVTVDDQGSPLLVQPIDDLSTEGLSDTPLADLEGVELEATPVTAEVFSVTFTPVGVNVAPFQP